jgi:VanZ family protein
VKISKQAYWLLPILWGAWIIYLSLLPGNAGILKLFGIPHFDKVAHMGAYGVWSFLFLFAAQKTLGDSKKIMWWIIGALILVGCGLEFAQYYMHEGRSFEVLDMVANSIGSVLGAWIGLGLLNRKTGDRE